MDDTYLSERKRIIYVYRTLFEPLLAAQRFIDALDEVHNIAEVGHGCKPGCQRCLVNMETRPTIGLVSYEAPNLCERLACILHELRLKCLDEVIRSKPEHKRDDKELFMKIACNHMLSLNLQQKEQSAAANAQYYEEEFKADILSIVMKYHKKMLEVVLENVIYKPMPAGDRNNRTIYLEQISEWAPDTRWYCDSIELEEDLLEAGKLRPVVVQRLLSHAGYIDLNE